MPSSLIFPTTGCCHPKYGTKAAELEYNESSEKLWVNGTNVL